MREVVRQLFGRAVVLGAVALVAVGISGLLAGVAGHVFGESWVAGDPPTVHYSPARCVDFAEYVSGATSCEQAATEHHFGEVVNYRIAAGVVGLIALGASQYLRRRREWRLFAIDRLPVAFDATVAAALFGAAGVWLTAYGIDQARLGYDGAGFSLTAGLVALGSAALAALRFVRSVDAARV